MDPVVCPDCDIDDAMLSNMIDMIGENCRIYCVYAVFSGVGLRVLQCLGPKFRV